ncbi:protein AAR2 homolog isoform X1 [Teleopsis dalmanni]|uniref:protein AAR2 homolog isoform X1 n=1 Tax=Teleopsis dalmanni TaxID=139649 RepID=UPI0018CDEFBE|nr:protein AAR2 homolog isoform X1 [Teleopsis dalmanni]
MNTDNCIDIDQNIANKLFEVGAFLIIAGVPVGTEFGVDLCSYTIGENFRGIKLIPPGPHYVWCSSQGQFGDAAPRVGFIHYFKSKEILVREWNRQEEELQERQIEDPNTEKAHIRENIKSLDRFLAPYDYRFLNKWKSLTNLVNEGTLSRCTPASGIIRTNVSLSSCPDAERPRGPIKSIKMLNVKTILNENDLLPNLKPLSGSMPIFIHLPNRVPQNATPEEVTRHSIDCIAAIDDLFNSISSFHILLEEIQLCFVFYLIGHSIESLDHWRRVIHLFSYSETATTKYKLFYKQYSELLALEIPYLPEELMEPTNRNTIYKDIRVLLKHLHSANLSLSAEHLSTKLYKELKWDFRDLLIDDPEDLPVVVELD